MAGYVTCTHCGLPFELPASALAPVLSCPRCRGEVINPRRFGRDFEVPFGSIAVTVIVLVLLSPCWGITFWLLLQPSADGFACGVPLILGAGGVLLWGVARQTVKRLVPGNWALLADIGLGALLALAFLLVTAAMCFGPRQ
jgi:hypothetical protein